MNNFEAFNFKVVPIGENKRPYVAWSQEETWCDWEERDEVYPNTKDWYVIPGQKVHYEIDGVEWGVFVIDIDQESPAQFQKAVQLVRSWKLPPTLLVKTKHNGWHLYYRALAEMMPRNCNLRANFNLPVEVKSNVGWVAPNGRDRIIVKDLPIAPLIPTEGTPFGDAVSIQPKRTAQIEDKPTNPDFPIEKIEIPSVGAGGRHNKCLGTVIWLKQQGCPRDKALDWAHKFYAANGRAEQRGEIENMWGWDTPVSDSATFSRTLPILRDPLEGAVELEGEEKLEAQLIFSTKEEGAVILAEYVSELAESTSEDFDFLAALYDDDIKKVKQAWVSATHEQRVKYEYLKEAIKSTLLGA